MNKKILFALWGGFFVLCAGLGFIPEASGFLKFLLAALAVGFFVPPFLILRECRQTGDRRTLKLVRNLAALSLGTTVVLLIVNLLSVLGSETMGDIAYYVLVIVSCPMVCGQYWVLSLFLWACLMFAGMKALKANQKTGR